MRTCGMRCHEFCYDSTDQPWLYPENWGSGLICNGGKLTLLHDGTRQKTEINKTYFTQRVWRENYVILKEIDTVSGFLRTQKIYLNICDNICVSNDHHQAICTKFRTEFCTDGLMMFIWPKHTVTLNSNVHFCVRRKPETVCISCSPKTQQMSSVQKLRGLLREHYLICHKYIIAAPDLIRGCTSWRRCVSNFITTNCATDEVIMSNLCILDRASLW